MKVNEITDVLNNFAPITLQEEYDNCGLITGNYGNFVSGVLLSLDCTEEVIDEAIQKGLNMVVAHHPILFSGIKKINGNSYIERVLIKAIKNDISIYAAHTNTDNIINGVNGLIAQKLGVHVKGVLLPKKGILKKLVTFCPVSHTEKVKNAIFKAGAGEIGNYSECSFNVEGTGTFTGNDLANPFVGKKGVNHTEQEIRIETIFQEYLQEKIIFALKEAHPYEEVAFDIYSLENVSPKIGSGIFGELEEKKQEKDFLLELKSILNCKIIRHTSFLNKPIKNVAICGGSGSFLLKNAIQANADIFISADFKYHQFFDAEGKILIADMGHFESEQFTPEIFYKILIEKFPKFAVHLSTVNTNPINYL